MRVSRIDETAVDMYENRLFTLQTIGEKFGVTRQAVKKFLNNHGVDTSDRLRPQKCYNCGKEMLRTRKRVRELKRPCCSRKCYYELINNPNYQQSRQGQRIAREVIDKLTTLWHHMNYVAHHVDGDDLNNDPNNLWAFKTNADHMKFHRFGESEAYIVSKLQWEKVSKELS